MVKKKPWTTPIIKKLGIVKTNDPQPHDCNTPACKSKNPPSWCIGCNS